MIKGFYSRLLAHNPASRNWGALRCTGIAFLTLACFIALNVAGCGGGGGGLTSSNPLATVIITVRDSSGNPVPNNAIFLNTKQSTTNGAGVAVFSSTSPGTYTLKFTYKGVTTVSSIAVSTDAQQTFITVEGSGASSNAGIVVRGVVLLNGNSGTATTATCDSGSIPVTDTVLIRVRDLNTPGLPIVASYIKPFQDINTVPAPQRGVYQFFNIPSPGTYRIEVRPAPGSSVPWAGQSPAFTVLKNQTITALNICANNNGVTPGVPPPPGTPTPVVTPTITGSPTPTIEASPSPSPSPSPSASPSPSPTVGLTPSPVPSASPSPSPSAGPSPSPTCTGPFCNPFG